MKRLRPFFSYYGSRWRLAPHYPKPVFDSIIEPFAGSAGYSLLYPSSKVFLSDLSEPICGAWDFILKAKESEVLSLPDIHTSISEDMVGYPEEAKCLVGFWMWRASPHWCDTISKNRPAESKGMYWGPEIRARIAQQQQFVRHWKIQCCSFMDLDISGSHTWFVDAPFKEKGVYYQPYSSKHLDFSALADWCLDRRGQLIVCEGMGADWLDFQPFKVAAGKMVKPGVEHVPHKDVIFTRVDGSLNSC